jgi:hypothetical protein
MTFNSLSLNTTKDSINRFLIEILTLAINCRLNGPDICNALATEKQTPRILSMVCSLRSCGGVTKVASPE